MTDFNSIENIPLVLTVNDVAKVLNVGKNTTYEIIHSGALKSIRIGRQIRISRDALLKYLEITHS